MTFKVEKGIPIPARQGRTECPFPFADLCPGDSFVVPIGDRSINSVRKWIGQWVPRFAKQFNCPRFTICCRPSEDKKSIRVWRIPDQDPRIRARRVKTNLYELPTKRAVK